MNCKNCNAKLKKGAQFCPNCGTKVEIRRFCTSCGTELAAGEQFCRKCGAQASSPSLTLPKKKLWIGIASAVVVLALAVTGAFLLFGGNSTTDHDNDDGSSFTDGAKTPQEAVEDYCRANNALDFEGMYDAMGLDMDGQLELMMRSNLQSQQISWEEWMDGIKPILTEAASDLQEKGLDTSEVEELQQDAEEVDSEEACIDFMGDIYLWQQRMTLMLDEEGNPIENEPIDLDQIADAETEELTEIDENNVTEGVFGEFCSYQASDVLSYCQVTLPDLGTFTTAETEQGWFVVSTPF